MKNWKIHSLYIIAFLILIIIALFAYKGGQQSDLVKYISFTGTIVSILLALLAIIYAFFSNSSVAQTLTSLRDMSKEVSTASDQISHLSQNLEEHLGRIPGFMESMESQVRETREIFLQERERTVILDKSTDSGSIDVTQTKIDINAFVKSSSITGLLLQLGCSISVKQQSGFNLYEFSKIIASNPRDDRNYGYVLGFLVSMSSAKLISYNLRDGGTLTVSFLNSGFITESIEERIKDRIIHYGKDEESKMGEYLERSLKNLKVFFQVDEKAIEQNTTE